MMEQIILGIVVAFMALDKAWKFLNSKKNGRVLKDDLKAALKEMIKDGELPDVKYNPHPPGETTICRENRDKIIENGEAIKNIEKRLDRFEKKINGIR